MICEAVRSGKLSARKIVRAVRRGDNSGYCITCGRRRKNTEPDAREVLCNRCKTNTVYGAEELLIMGVGMDFNPTTTTVWPGVICEAVKNGKLSARKILRAALRDDNSGYCVACGKRQMYTQPYAREDPCNRCKTNTVYGAEALRVLWVG